MRDCNQFLLQPSCLCRNLRKQDHTWWISATVIQTEPRKWTSRVQDVNRSQLLKKTPFIRKERTLQTFLEWVQHAVFIPKISAVRERFWLFIKPEKISNFRKVIFCLTESRFSVIFSSKQHHIRPNRLSVISAVKEAAAAVINSVFAVYGNLNIIGAPAIILGAPFWDKSIKTQNYIAR